MQLDREGEPGTIAGLLAVFGSTRPWFENELTFLDGLSLADRERADGREEAERTGSVRIYPGGLSTDEPVETDSGPFVVIVDGDLVTPDYIRFSTDEYFPGLIVVTGDLHAGTLLFELGARVIVEGSAFVARACFGQYGDANAMLHVDGVLETPLLALDINTAVFSQGGIRSVISAGLGWWKTLKPDIPAAGGEDCFRQEVLKYGGLDLRQAFAAAREGSPLFLPGAEESFPQRLEARPALSGYEPS